MDSKKGSLLGGVQSSFFIVLVISIVLLALLNFPIRNQDGFKNLILGKYISWFSSFPHYSSFTFLPVKRVVESDTHDWLGSVLLYNVYSSFGYKGLHFFKVFYLLPYLILTTKIFDKKFTGWWFMVNFGLVFLISSKLYLRTAGLSVIFFGLMLTLLILYRDFNYEKSVYFLIPVLTVWGNVHGFFIGGSLVSLFFLVGLLLDDIPGRNVFSSKSSLRVLLVIVLILLSVTFVKPNPDYNVLERTKNGLSRVSYSLYESGSSDRGSEDETGLLRVIKGMTHGIIVSDRPYVAPEFNFTLSLLNYDPPHLKYVKIARFTFFILLPIFLLSLFTLRRTVSWSTILPLVFLLWLGVGVVRAVPYVGIFGLPVLALEWKKHAQLSDDFPLNSGGKRWAVERISRHFVTLFGLTIIVVQLMATYGGIDRRSINSYLPFRTHSTKKIGLSYHIDEEFIGSILRKYPDRRIHTYPMGVGSISLWTSWPFKKVSFYSKTRAYKEEFLRRYYENMSQEEFLSRYGIELALIGRPKLVDWRDSFRGQSDWRPRYVSMPDRELFFFCKSCR